MEKETWKQKLKKAFHKKSIKGFMDQFGFYFILLVCLGIIGVTAFLTRGGKDNQPIPGEEQNPANIQVEGESSGIVSPGDIDITITDITDGNMDSSPTDSQKGLPADDAKEAPGKDDKDSPGQTKEPVDKKEDASSKSEEDVATGSKADSTDNGKKTDEEDVPASAGGQSDAKVEMAMPVNGRVIQPYSADELIYSQTLKEWTTHTGIDIAGTLGGEVRAALAGVVESIEEDSLKGIVITLAHENDLKSVYTGLSTEDMVRTGQSVDKGQVISGIGRTAAFEITYDPHLHFEVLLNGKHQDPTEYLKLE